MKNVNRFLILCLALCVALSVAIFAADGEETVKIKDVDTKANVSAENFEGEENFKLTYSDANDNGMYLLLVLSKPEDAGEDFDPAEDLKPEDGNILYVNQATAEGTDVVFENVYPTEILEEDTYIFLAGADTGFILLGTIVPDVEEELPPPAGLTVNAIGSGANIPAYVIDGHIVTVTYSLPCKLGYENDGGTYTAIVATNNGDGSYSYVVPDNVSEVIVVAKGDVTGDGRLMANDTIQVKAAQLRKQTFNALQNFAADVTGEGRLMANDAIQVKAAQLRKIVLAW